MYPIALLVFSCFLFSILADLLNLLSIYINPIQQSFFRNFFGILILAPFFFNQKFFKVQIKSWTLNFKRFIWRYYNDFVIYSLFTNTIISSYGYKF